MFKILNQANQEEIAIISAIVDSLNNKEKDDKIINYWDSSSKKSSCERHTWKNKSISNWESSNKAY